MDEIPVESAVGISASSISLRVCLGPSLALISDANKNRFPDVSFRFSQQQHHFCLEAASSSSASSSGIINHGRAVPNEQPPSTQSQYWNSGNSNPSVHTADLGKKQQPPPLLPPPQPPQPHAITNFSSNLNQARDSKFLRSQLVRPH